VFVAVMRGAAPALAGVCAAEDNGHSVQPGGVAGGTEGVAGVAGMAAAAAAAAAAASLSALAAAASATHLE
jgi:hypothetical protein